jgi:hypothetical protein
MDYQVKEFLLEWLLNHGREPVYRHIAWGFENGRWILFEKCVNRGYIDSLQDPFTRKHNHKLTDIGLEHINKGENDGTNE